MTYVDEVTSSPIREFTRLLRSGLAPVQFRADAESPERSVAERRERRVDVADLVIRELGRQRRVAPEEQFHTAADVHARLGVGPILRRGLRCVEAIEADAAGDERMPNAAFPVVHEIAVE